MGTIDIPLRMDSDGAIRVGKTRVALDIVIRAYQHGVSPEAIVERFPVVSLSDLYACIAYYLQHRTEIDDYFHKRAAQGEAVRRENEARFDNSALYERLLRELEDQQQQS